MPRIVNRNRQPYACLLGKFPTQLPRGETILTPTPDIDIHSPSLPSEALEEFLSILRPPSFLYTSPTSPLLRRKNNGAMIPFDRQHATRKGENAWSPKPPSPNKSVNSFKTLTPDDFVSTERLDSDQDLSTITWYPFDWRTGGPTATHSPLRKSLVHLLFRHLSSSCPSSCSIPISGASKKITPMGFFSTTGHLITSTPSHLLLIRFTDQIQTRL